MVRTILTISKLTKFETRIFYFVSYVMLNNSLILVPDCKMKNKIVIANIYWILNYVSTTVLSIKI